LASSVLLDLLLLGVDVSHLGEGGSGLLDLLGLLDDLLSVLLNLGLLLFNQLGELLNLLLESSLLFLGLGSLSLLNFLNNLGGGLRADRGLSLDGLLLDLDCLLLESPDGLVHRSDLGADDVLLLFISDLL